MQYPLHCKNQISHTNSGAVNRGPNTVNAPWIDNLRISHNASGMEANIRVFLIRNSSSHSSLDVYGLALPCLAATLCFTRLHYQGSSLMHS